MDGPSSQGFAVGQMVAISRLELILIISAYDAVYDSIPTRGRAISIAP